MEGIDQLHNAISSRQRDLFRFIVACDEREVWVRDGCRDMAQWLSGRLGLSYSAALRWVKAAHKLEHLPRLSQAFACGEVSLDKVVQLARFATPQDEELLLGWARRVSVTAIRKRADVATRPELAEVAEVETSRRVAWWYFDDGRRFGLEAELPAADGARLAAAIDRIAGELPEVPEDASLDMTRDTGGLVVDGRDAGSRDAGGPGSFDPADVRLALTETRRADALLQLALGGPSPGRRASRARHRRAGRDRLVSDDLRGPGDASGRDESEPGDAPGDLDPRDPRDPMIVIHATVESLAPDGPGCAVEGGPVLHPETARRLVCDGRLQSVVHDGSGGVVGIGRSSRVVPRWLYRQLRHRDGGACTFPGCAAARFLQAHHVVHWQHGGRTDLDNLVLVCHFHHKLVHERAWTVELAGDAVTWRRPGGAPYCPGEGAGRADAERGPPINV